MRAANESLLILSPGILHKLVPREIIASDESRSPESLLRALGEPAVAARLTGAGLRYVVVLDASYATGPWETEVGKGGGFTVTKEQSQDATTEASILDLKHLRIAGSVRTRSIGEEWVGVGVYVIVPFPIYAAGNTESGNCKALGKELAKFFGSKE